MTENKLCLKGQGDIFEIILLLLHSFHPPRNEETQQGYNSSQEDCELMKPRIKK